MKNFFRILIKDNVDAMPLSVYKRCILAGQLSVLALSAGIIYTIIEFIHGETNYVPFYGILIFGSLASLILLRYSKFNAAKYALLISAIVVVGVFSSIESYLTGVYMNYIIVCLAAFTLFGYRSINSSFIITGIALTLFCLIYFFDVINIFEPVVYGEEYLRTSFAVNFFISIFSTILMFYYILSINHTSEREIQHTADSLQKITDELRVSQSRFELAIRGSSAGIWDWNFKKSQIYVSPKAARILGYEPEELRYLDYHGFLDLIHPSDCKILTNCIENHIKYQETFQVEVRFRKKDGSYIWVLDTGQAEWDRNGRPIKMVGSVIDITERKKAEQEVYEKNAMLSKTNEELDRFVYSTSHDLKAPLCSLSGLVHIAGISESQEEKEKCLKLMHDRIDTLNGFIKDILSYSKNSRLGVTVDEINLSFMIDGILKNLDYYPNRDQLKIIKNFPEDLSVLSDRGRLKIILNNLITNAIKYHNFDQSQPYVKIGVEKLDNRLEIKIEDNGQGIDEQYKKQIFNMFYRASESSQGSGLGLYIAKEMIDKLAGSISVDSTAGVGSVFAISIPCRREACQVA
ncbi:PAS domain S-box protein [Fulvivirga sp. RKSG066]|uniref:sensor histidine kinase n=1 Tax=Fulvivirga aurantia TaxID=2529383 RepID=UPI0012BC7F9E|nr:PAS domain-containing sensor histidine kinase [Fulvivirga aurantia]MTI23291.1 PAS domain S-box protein [Fulvivirga aurantia]